MLLCLSITKSALGRMEMRPYPRLREREVERERDTALCNPYYMPHRAGELFKKLFVVFFLKVSSGDGMRAAALILWPIMRFQLRG